MRLLISVVAAIILLAGCAVPTKETVGQKWLGRSLKEAISEFGPPTSSMVLPGGVTMYIWETSYGAANAPSRAVCRTGLVVDSKGKIVDVSQLSESLLC